MATIVLSDGTTLSNLEVNGDNFIADYSISDDVFINNMSPVTIDSDNEHAIHDHMDLVQLIRKNNQYWFILRDISEDELKQIKLRGDVDFIAMMSDIDLDDVE